MTEERLIKIAKAFFHQERPGMTWEEVIPKTKASWRSMVNAVVIELDKGTPLEELSEKAWPHHFTDRDLRNSEWERCVSFTITEYLLTPKGE